MTGFVQHLESLTSSAIQSSADENRILDEWASHKGHQEGVNIFEHNTPKDVNEEDSRASVLDVFRIQKFTPPIKPDTVISRLISKSNVEPLMAMLHSTLSSSRPNDDISGDIAELVGFDDIELVMEILDNRASIVQELSEYNTSSTDINDSLTPHRKGKNNQTEVKALTSQEARTQMEKKFRENAARPLFSGSTQAAPEILPHVYTSSSVVQGSVLSPIGNKYTLPIGTTRHDHEDYEEVIIPPAKPVPPRETERLISVSELDPLARGSFPVSVSSTSDIFCFEIRTKNLGLLFSQ
jgi:antiviral helicase SLH1